MKRKIMIAAVLLFASLAATISYAFGTQKYIIYYAESSFSTPVGKKFIPSGDDCNEPYDTLHSTGSVTSYVYTQYRSSCGGGSAWATCQVNGTTISCPPTSWVEDWWSLGNEF
jgi:hypothetical protein